MNFQSQTGSALLEKKEADGVPTAQSPDHLLPFRTVEMAKTCEGKDMVLQEKDGSYFLYLGGEMLMGGKYHESEEALATIGCRALHDQERPRILIGGLGMGFTLRAVLDEVGPAAEIVTAELSEVVIRWNQPGEPLADAPGCPVEDPRSLIAQQDLCELIRESDPEAFDAILIDTDNEPHALSYSGNDSLYTLEGLTRIRRALRPGGILGFWFLRAPVEFDRFLNDAGFSSRRYDVPGGKGGDHLIIIAKS
jgi:spermidine synthase